MVDAKYKNLLSQLIDPELIDEVVSSCSQLVRDEATQKRGVTGVVIKGGLKIIEKIRPGILDDLFHSLLPTFIERLTPLYEEYLNHLDSTSAQTALSDFVMARAHEVTEVLLSVTDSRAERSKLTALVGAYRKLRPLAEEHIIAALPALGALLDRYTHR